MRAPTIPGMFRLAALFPPRRRAGVGIATALVMTAVIAGGLLPFREELAGSAAGLAFIVPVVVGTAVGGAVAAVVAVSAGFVAYNALFTSPYLTLVVADPGDVIGLVVFVVVGAVTATIVTLRQREADAARRREKEALALYELSRSFVEGDLQVALDATVEAVRELFEVVSVAIVTDGPGGEQQVVADAGSTLPASTLQRLPAAAEPYDWSDRGTSDEHVLPLLAGARSVGCLVVIGAVPDAGIRLLSVFANNVALALHRAQLATEATRVEVLEETDRVRSALIRSVSHDLRTPLASIVAAGQDLADEELVLSPDDQRLLGGTVAEEGQRLNRLVTNLLDLSRIESGRLELRPEAVDLQELVEGAMVGRDEPVTVDLAAGLPPLWVDPLLLEQVLRNLLDNAGRHAGGSPVVVRGWCADRMAVVEVEDRGPGVPDTLKERIFIPFHQVGDGSRPSHSGVGLAICKAYVEAHDGTVQVLDTPGGGATFRVTVPLAEAPAGERLP